MMSGNKSSLHMITFALLAIGGLNWLLFGLTGSDIGSWLPGGMGGSVAKVVYILVGLSAVYEIAMHKKHCKMCGEMMAKKSPAMGGSSTGSGSSMGGSM